ncbi:MAG: hypothetical protein KatS3mg060_0413 [Dehalococcoidia bacterium]|nr:MAG: hypothetical protein KatS3mg060_0413 [Dehalococcoidia bacterium]
MALQQAIAIEGRQLSIDIGLVWRSIWRGRWTILACVTIAAVIGGVASPVVRLLMPQYSADAQVVLTGSKYRLELDPKFTTVDILSANVATVSRAEEYRAIVSSQQTRALALQRAAALTGQGTGQREAIERASVQPQIRGNLITLRAVAASPELAALVAKVYADAVVTRVDEVYATTEQDLKLLEARLAEAVAANEAAEAAVIRFLETSPLALLTQRIDQQKQLLETLSVERRAAIESEVGRSYALLGKLDELRRNGLALREQVRAGNQSAASRSAAAVSLFLLQRDLTLLSAPSSERRSSSETPAERSERSELPSTVFQVDLTALTGQAVSPETLLADVESFLTRVEQRRTEVLDTIAASATTLAALPSADSQPFAVGQLGERDAELRGAIAALSADLARKDAERQAAQYRLDALTNDAKLTREARSALAAKVQETLIAAASSGRAVVVSISDPVDAWPPLWTWAASGAAVGLILGTVLVAVRAITERREADTSSRSRRSIG